MDLWKFVFIAWLIAGFIFLIGFVFGACFRRPKEGHIRVGKEWMTAEEYLKRKP